MDNKTKKQITKVEDSKNVITDENLEVSKTEENNAIGPGVIGIVVQPD